MVAEVILSEHELRTESHSASRFAGQRIHFIGIGGSGMCGLARVLLDCGAIVQGSDLIPTTQTEDLARRGAIICYSQCGSMLHPEVDLVVRTAAVADENPEFRKAVHFGLPRMKYAQLLGQVMDERFGIAICGTHGKSTTTSMTSFALLRCGADPSFVVGGTARQLGGSSRSGSGQAFVVEACEYDRSFHNLHPKVAVITNIEADHLDCYKGGIGEIVESFRTFAARVPAHGLIIANGRDLRVAAAVERLDGPVQWVDVVGPDEPGLHARLPSECCWETHITGATNGYYRGDVYRGGRQVATLALSTAGEHNLWNATMALAACDAAGVDLEKAARALNQFVGVDRRMTEMGRRNGAIVVDDYGHHPTEIRTTLKALRERYAPHRLICVFQPHQASRTRLLLDDFAISFGDSDLTIIPDIYSVRDSDDDRQAICAADLVRRIEQCGSKARHIADFEGIVSEVGSEAAEGDLIVTMGAGSVWQVAQSLVKKA